MKGAILNVAAKAPGEPEIFVSVQGEGRNLGQVRTFLRLSGCNLHCRWCDTPYTWNWVGTKWAHAKDRVGHPHKFDRKAEAIPMVVAEAARLILAADTEGVVITGGEPMLQSKALLALAAELRSQRPGLMIEMETNGTLAPSAELVEAVDLFMVSPKLATAGDKQQLRIRPSALRSLAALDSSFFKFVATGIEDIAEIAGIADSFGIAPSRIYVMPEGTASEQLIRAGQSLIDTVIAHRFNYSDRLHVHLFGDERGT